MKLEPDKFPIDAHLPEIAQAIDRNPCVLIKAETGAGKTTRLPPYLLGNTSGKILVLEPRRLAAKLTAERCAQILDEYLGESVGHHIRFEKTASESTRLLFITEGLFLPYLRQDPDLKEYSVVILDEFHERSIHTDVTMALIRRLQTSTRPDLKLVVMSATLETEKLESYLETPTVFNISGRTFPIDIEYRDMEPATAVEEMLKQPLCPLNILVFLSGMGEIKRLEQQLKGRLPEEIEIVILHSSLSKSQQNKAFQGDKRKVILSTNIAETSLTIPNVTGVVDLGKERRASFAPWSGMPLLQLEKISKASATQRAGRAGRVQNGLVYRLYSEADHFQRIGFTPPEIRRVELSHYVLDLLELNIHPDTLDWFEPPEEKNLERALDLLTNLGALKNDNVTELGSFLARLPLHPRLGAMLYKCPDSILPDVLLAACVISEGMALANSAEFSQDDEEVCDLCVQLDLIKARYHNDKNLSDYNHAYLDQKKATRALDLYQALATRLQAPKEVSKKKTSHPELVLRLLAGFPDRIAAKRLAKAKGRQVLSYNFCLGRGGRLAFKSALSGNSPEYIIVLDALEDPKANAATGTTIQAASKITSELLLNSGSPFLAVEKESVFNEKKGTLSISSHTKYGKLTLNSETLPPVIPKGESLVSLMLENWPWPFEDDAELKEYHQRVRLLEKAGCEHNCPLFEEEMFELFLESCVEEETDYKQVLSKGLKVLIRDQLSPQDEYVLDNETPKTIKLCNGKEFSVHYDEDMPYISARIQDLYSVNEHPYIVDGKIPLIVKLLSPANRIAQVAQDLPGFWKSSWESVRKELKARYPKHYWPENPESSDPIRFKNRLT